MLSSETVNSSSAELKFVVTTNSKVPLAGALTSSSPSSTQTSNEATDESDPS